MLMKMMRTTTSDLMKAGNNSRRHRKPRFENPVAPMFPETPKAAAIQWPSEKQVRDVSRQLVKIGQIGVRSEAKGDYFNSGDLAYQMQEIIRATAELYQRGQRIRH
jgi:hypothetical protein